MSDSTPSAARAATPARTSSQTSTPDPSKPAYYAIIPADVRYHPDLTANAKLLYGEITALCSREGYCWATNQYFADLYGVKVLAIKRWIGALVKAGFIETEVNAPAGNTRRIYLVSKKIPARIPNDTTSYPKRYEARIKKDTHSITLSITSKNIKNPERLPAALPDKAGGVGGASDPLAELSAEEFAALEQKARAKVIAELRPPICDLARQGKALRDVKAMMRVLLAEQGGGG